MPVTQPRQELKTPAEPETKTQKYAKLPIKLHAPGFHDSINLLLVQRGKLVANVLDSRKDKSEHAYRSVSQHPRRTTYTHTDAYAAFFVGSRANLGTAHIPLLANTYLRPNAQFVGGQQSGALRYDIRAEIKTVDLVSSVVTGFFQISGLTEEHPLITTCFKGEIINNPLHRMDWGTAPVTPRRYSFVTEESNWLSFPKNDLDHWKKLTGCDSLCTEDELRHRLQRIQAGEQDPLFIYMRWKEEFLLPDSRVKLLTGASFEGFYYVVLNIGTARGTSEEKRLGPAIPPGTMSGLYFYTQSEKFQSLSLRYVEDRYQAGTFDFA